VLKYGVFKKFCAVILGLELGITAVYFIFFHTTLFSFEQTKTNKTPQHQVIGFLLYSLLSRARIDYSKEITTLTYFGLTLAPDGTIQKLNTPQEEEPGWYALSSGKVIPFLESAKSHNVALSLPTFGAEHHSRTAPIGQ